MVLHYTDVLQAWASASKIRNLFYPRNCKFNLKTLPGLRQLFHHHRHHHRHYHHHRCCLSCSQIKTITSLYYINSTYFRNIQSMGFTCQKKKRFGNVGDGGYDVCMDEPFVPRRNNCLVYSFG